MYIAISITNHYYSHWLYGHYKTLKKNMKKITFLLGALVMGITGAFAQTYDVGIKNILTPANGSSINAGLTTVRMTLMNYGDSLAPSDSIKIGISVNGTVLTSNAGTPARGYATGDSVILALNLNFSTLPAGSNAVCVKTSRIVGKTDSDTTNDESCSTFIIVLPDLSVDSLAVTSPAVSNGDTLLTNTTVSGVLLRIRNNGTVPFATSPIPISFSINGTSSNLSLPITRAIPPGGTVNGNIPANLITVQPSSAGTYDVCGASNLSNDADNSNNQTCISFTVHEVLSISSLSPAKGLVGSDVTINGAGFSSTASENSVTFNGTAATIKSSTSSSITATVPTGATTGKVKVMAYNQEATSGNDFEVLTEAPASISSFDGIDNVIFYANDNIHFTLNKKPGLTSIMNVMDIFGKIVLTETISAESGQVNVDQLNAGTYIITIDEAAYKFVK